MKRRQNIHQHTCVRHLLSAGCCLVTEGTVGLNRDGQRNIACYNKTSGYSQESNVIVVTVTYLYLTTIIAF